jgi:hypothetical protein
MPKLDPYDPLIKAHLNNGTELKCAVQEDLVYSVNGTIFINWEVVNISLPTLTYCKYDVIWRPPYEAKKHNFYTLPFSIDEENIDRKFRNVYLRRHYNTFDRR